MPRAFLIKKKEGCKKPRSANDHQDAAYNLTMQEDIDSNDASSHVTDTDTNQEDIIDVTELDVEDELADEAMAAQVAKRRRLERDAEPVEEEEEEEEEGCDEVRPSQQSQTLHGSPAQRVERHDSRSSEPQRLQQPSPLTPSRETASSPDLGNISVTYTPPATPEKPDMLSSTPRGGGATPKRKHLSVEDILAKPQKSRDHAAKDKLSSNGKPDMAQYINSLPYIYQDRRACNGLNFPLPGYGAAAPPAALPPAFAPPPVTDLIARGVSSLELYKYFLSRQQQMLRQAAGPMYAQRPFTGPGFGYYPHMDVCGRKLEAPPCVMNMMSEFARSRQSPSKYDSANLDLTLSPTSPPRKHSRANSELPDKFSSDLNANFASKNFKDFAVTVGAAGAGRILVPGELGAGAADSLHLSPVSDTDKSPSDVENLPLDLVSRSTEKKTRPGPPRFQCDGCKKSYSTFNGLSKHKEFHCTSHVKKEFSCQHCNKTYTSLGALKMHIRTHTLPCKCQICGKAFSRPWLLQGHVRTHTGEKPFQCPHCGRSFADRSNLRAHLQTHTDVKKYNCKTCTKTFSRMSLLLKHQENSCVGMAR